MKKRFISFLMAFAMCLSILPTVFASEDTTAEVTLNEYVTINDETQTSLNPYEKTSVTTCYSYYTTVDTFSFSSGATSNAYTTTYLVFKGVDFGELGAESLEFEYAHKLARTGTITFCTATANTDGTYTEGTQIAAFTGFEATGSYNSTATLTKTAAVTADLTGVHDIMIKFGSKNTVPNAVSFTFTEKVVFNDNVTVNNAAQTSLNPYEKTSVTTCYSYYTTVDNFEFDGGATDNAYSPTYLIFKGVDFGELGAESLVFEYAHKLARTGTITFCTATANTDGTYTEGTQIAAITGFEATGSYNSTATLTKTAAVTADITGVHDIMIKFGSKNTVPNAVSFTFTEKTADDGSGDNTGDGSEDGSGDDVGDGSGDGSGDDAGDGSEDGSGDGTEETVISPYSEMKFTDTNIFKTYKYTVNEFSIGGWAGTSYAKIEEIDFGEESPYSVTFTVDAGASYKPDIYLWAFDSSVDTSGYSASNGIISNAEGTAFDSSSEYCASISSDFTLIGWDYPVSVTTKLSNELVGKKTIYVATSTAVNLRSIKFNKGNGSIFDLDLSAYESTDKTVKNDAVGNESVITVSGSPAPKTINFNDKNIKYLSFASIDSETVGNTDAGIKVVDDKFANIDEMSVEVWARANYLDNDESYSLFQISDATDMTSVTGVEISNNEFSMLANGIDMSVNDSHWTHYVFTQKWDDDNSEWDCNIYANGSNVLTFSKKDDSRNSETSNFLSIGNNGSFNSGFVGDIAEFRVYSKVLDADGVKSRYDETVSDYPYYDLVIKHVTINSDNKVVVTVEKPCEDKVAGTAYIAVFNKSDKKLVDVDVADVVVSAGDISVDIPTDVEIDAVTEELKVFIWNENMEPISAVGTPVVNPVEYLDFTVEVEAGREPVILQLTDTQIIDAAQEREDDLLGSASEEYWATDRMDENCFDYLREVVTNTNPDLILLTGDLVYGMYDDAGTSFTALIEVMESFEIPWAPVFGNHEIECALGADWQCQQLENATYCLFKQRTLTGNGNYSVGITQGGVLKRVFFMMDSNGCGIMSDASKNNGHSKSTAGFADDQIAWYTDVATKINRVSPGMKYSFVYHIQQEIFRTALSQYGTIDSNTVYNPINIDTAENKAETDFGHIGRNLKTSWDTDFSIYNGMKALGCDSHFVGHEHCNSASVVYDGTRFQYGQKSSTYDRANYIVNGTICGSYSNVGIPIIGGTVMKMSKEDGSFGECYIYYCDTESQN